MGLRFTYFVWGLLGMSACHTVYAGHVSVGGRIQVDNRRHIHPGDNLQTDSHEQTDLVDVRRIRLKIAGQANALSRFKFTTELSDGKPELKDAYLDVMFGKPFRTRIGQFHLPFANESLGSSRFAVFLEQATISSALSAGRDSGIMFHGPLFADNAYYQLAAVDGTGANTPDNNDTYDIAGRFVFNPRFITRHFDSLVAWLGMSFTSGDELGGEDEQIKLKTESHSGSTYFSAPIPEGVSYQRDRIGIEYTILKNAFMFKGEWLQIQYRFSQSAWIKGGYLALSYFISGEQHDIHYGLLTRQKINAPERPRSNAGAWELAFRYSWFDIDPVFFQDNGLYEGWTGVSDTEYTRSGYAFTSALNWYMNPHARLMINWIFSFKEINASMDASSAATVSKQAESSLTSRLQIDF